MAPKKVRPIRVEGNIAFVPLTKGYEAVIDAADVHLVDGRNWCAMALRHTAYAQRTDCSGPKPRTVYLHRAIMGEPDGFQVDHIDSDGLNNRRLNLREATGSQNQHNQRLAKHNTSGLKGVTWHKAAGKWQAQIKLKGKQRFLGLHATLEAAHATYAAASAALHKEFGRIA
jgi:hypothetical protein